MSFSRRSFVGMAAASLSTASLLARAAKPDNSVIGGVRIGVQTYSFRDMLSTPGDMADKMIAGMQQLGLTECEMFEPCLQPPELSAAAAWRMVGGKPTQASLLGRPPTKGPDAAALAQLEAVRKWRLGEGLDQIRTAAARFKKAGITIFAFNYSLKDSCTDAEIERGLDMTEALGTRIMTASTTLTMAKRCVPFFQKRNFVLALHGHSNLEDPNQFATPDSFEQGLALSPLYRVNLDIGHFSAAGFDPVAFIRAHHQKITNLHLKDRKNHDGPNMPFGEGDTPIKPVLQLLEQQGLRIPADIEYEYAGSGSSVQEVGKCLDYIRAALT